MVNRFASFLVIAFAITVSASALAGSPASLLKSDDWGGGPSKFLQASNCMVTNVVATQKDVIRISFNGKWLGVMEYCAPEFSVSPGSNSKAAWLEFVGNAQTFIGRHADITIDADGKFYSRGDCILDVFPMDRVTITPHGGPRFTLLDGKQLVIIEPKPQSLLTVSTGYR